MTTTTHDIGISWMDCPVCAELHREVERADAEADKAWETFSFFEATYREAFAAGMVGFGTTAWTQWHDLLDQLRHAYYDATDTARARLDAWGESICEHAKPQAEDAETTEADTDDDMAETADAPAAGDEGEDAIDSGEGYGDLRAVAAINAFDDAGLCMAADLLYPILDDVTDLLQLDPHRLDGYRTRLTRTVFRRSDRESRSSHQGSRQARQEGA